MRYFVIAAFLAPLWAQEDPLGFGLMLRAHSGVALGFFGKLEQDFKPANALGRDFRLRPLATTAGANLDLLIARRLLLGGTLQLQHYDASETERGLVRPYALHYGGQIGFAAINKNLWLFYPYVGYQVGTYEVRYTNYFTEPIFFGTTQQLRPLEKRTYSSSLGLVELGLGLRRYRRGEGVSLFWGVDLGGVFAPSKGSWKASEGPDPQGVNPPQLSAGYLRFSLGFGYVKPKSESAPSPIPAAPEAEKPKKDRKAKKAEEAAAPEKAPSPAAPGPEKPKKKKKSEEATQAPPAAPSTPTPEKSSKKSKKKAAEDEE
ncbi:MAG: hypothetical protein KatS3mg026_0400 [Bacteroidia bacterium]|nr:MAG: hypothetical protein KatS3mg026_0400 [Bacteroidia bacterium]